MITEYINNKGDLVVISKMPDAYLLNSYAYYKKRITATRSGSLMSKYDIDLAERAQALKAEIDKRKLI